MKHYVVLLDRAAIPADPRIPEFDHVWVEHPHTAPGECVDHLWRATIGVTHQTPVTHTELDGCPKLRLLIVTGPDVAVADAAACRERDIQVIHLPQGDLADQAWADVLVARMEAFAAQNQV
jgi:phosphoglycerate dehydrogenase-like enzyme